MEILKWIPVVRSAHIAQSTINSIAITNQSMYRVRQKISESGQLLSRVGIWLARRRECSLQQNFVSHRQRISDVSYIRCSGLWADFSEIRQR